MGKADTEIQTILSHLTVIYWRNIDTITGRSRRPSGADWIQLDHLVHRLLVLRGTIKMDEKIPEDPWQLFLDEYAPIDTIHPTMDEKPSSFQSYPNSILLRSASSSSSAGGCDQNDQNQQQQNGQSGHRGENSGSHQNQAGVESERHIRFDSNLPGRMRHRRFPVSPAPHSRV